MSGGFVWDDGDYVTENPTLRTLDGLQENWTATHENYQYYPLALTTFWIEYHLWGLNPVGYHILNVLLHGSNALLVWVLLRRLEVRGAWLGAAIFGLHPVHVESVAWITERKNVLSLFFYLLAALSYLQFVSLERSKEPADAGTPSPAKGRLGPAQRGAAGHAGWLYYCLSLGLFTGALLSKTVTLTLPAAMLLVIYWKRGRIRARDVVQLAPFFAVGLGLGLVTAWVETHQMRAQGQYWSLTVLERCLIAGRALWFYAGKLVAPVNLTFFYPRWEVSTAVWWQFLYPTAALAAVGGLWVSRKRLGRGPLVAVLFFAGTLTPALGFFNVYPMRYSFVADHFQYHASIGLIALGAAALASVFALCDRRLPRAGLALGGALIIVLGVQTWEQGKTYKDLETLCQRTLARNPSAWVAESLLAELRENDGRYEEALAHDRRALELNPNDPDLKNNVGTTLAQLGRYEEAVAVFKSVLAQHPDLAATHGWLAMALHSLGRDEEAEEHLRLAKEAERSQRNGKGLGR